MFKPTYRYHQGMRILVLDYSDLAPSELVRAIGEAGAVIAAAAPGSLRVLTLMNSGMTKETAETLRKQVAMNAPFVHKSAVVASNFWNVVYVGFQTHGRGDIMLFDEESEALAWLVSG